LGCTRRTIYTLVAFVLVAKTELAAQATWRVSPTPLLTIGVVEGDSSEMLFRVAGVFRHAAGGYIVANGGTQEIRAFDAKGKFQASGGRKGEGPGEFVQLRSVLPYGRDSLLAYDFQLRRLSVFTVGTKYVRSFLMPRIKETSWPQPVGVFPDGSIMVQTGRVFMMGDDPSKGSEVNRDPTVLYRMSRTGEVLDSIAAVPGWERYVRRVVLDGNRPGFTVHTVPFARIPSFAVSGNRVFVGASDSYAIDVFGLNGKLERTIRLNRPNRPVTRKDIDLLRKTRLKIAADQNEAARQRAQTALDEMQVPATMPAYGSFHGDPYGNLWVQEYRAEGEQHTRWTVLDPTGRVVANVTGPNAFTVYEIGRDHIIGLRRDDLDVEHVEVYRLTR
jgi:hypothetical protein